MVLFRCNLVVHTNVMSGQSGKHKIEYVQQDEPAFLKRFKQAAGYKEGPQVSDKFGDGEAEISDRSDNEEEQPVVVVLKKGQLTAEEVEKHKALSKSEETEKKHEIGEHIQFKRKEKSEEKSIGLLSATSKVKKTEEDKKDTKQKPEKNIKLAVKNTSLLSFNEDEEEDY